jgi:ParB family transcriptional regulator, chromosome partitioning protein
MIHELKIWTNYFNDICSGKLDFCYRKNDRGYRVGDILRLNEYIMLTKNYTGNYVECVVTYIMDDVEIGIPKGYCVLGLERIDG